MDLYVYSFHPKAAEYTFFSSAYGIFPRIDNMLDHKTNLNKFEKNEIKSSIFSDHNSMRLEIDYKKKKLQKTQTHGGLQYAATEPLGH